MTLSTLSYDEKRDAGTGTSAAGLNRQDGGFILNKPRGLYLSSFKVLNRFLVKK